ncbi:energy-coupling factor transporter transmembrane component T family protein [Pasteurellaceae bacterium 22721_9_1]
MKFPFFQPHFRLIYAFLLSLLISAVQHIPLLVALNGVALVLFISLIFYFRKSLMTYVKLWSKLHIFTLLLWLTLSWKISPQGIILNPKGINLALLMSLRINLILILLWTLLLNINDSILLQAIQRLPLPRKLVYLFVLTVRYIAVFKELHQNMDMAMRARGFQAKFNARTFYVSAQRVALLLIHAMMRVERTEMALKARGFQLQQITKKNG